MLPLRNLLVLFPAVGALAACVGPPPAPPPPPPQKIARPASASAPAPLAAPAPAANWVDRALTPGTWAWRTDARGAVALYGPVGTEAAVVVRCDKAAQRVYVSRPAAGGSQMVLRATTGAQAYPARPTGGTPPYVAAELAANDRQLDAIAFSRGRFMVQLDGAADAIVPSWPELARVIEECRG
jgi:hypothetical protein